MCSLGLIQAQHGTRDCSCGGTSEYRCRVETVALQTCTDPGDSASPELGHDFVARDEPGYCLFLVEPMVFRKSERSRPTRAARMTCAHRMRIVVIHGMGHGAVDERGQ